MSIFRFRVFQQYFSQKFRSFAEYPLNFSMTLFWSFFSLLVFYFFWSLVFSKGNVPNYNLSKIILYYLFVLGLQYNFDFVKDIRRSIIDGTIIQSIVRKISLEEYFIYRGLSNFFVWRLVPFFIVLIVGIYFLGVSALFGMLIFLLGVIVGILVYCLLISLSFWTGENWALSAIIDEIIVLSSGGILPLDLFPVFFQVLLIDYLPFNLMFFIPAKVFLGDIAVSGFLLIKYLLWILALYLILKFVVKRGLRKYEQLGG